MDIEAMKLWRQVFVTCVRDGKETWESEQAANFALEGFMKAFLSDTRSGEVEG